MDVKYFIGKNREGSLDEAHSGLVVVELGHVSGGGGSGQSGAAVAHRPAFLAALENGVQGVGAHRRLAGFFSTPHQRFDRLMVMG